MQHKNAPVEFKADPTGSFEGYASIFGNVDLGGDVIAVGAFKQIASGRDGRVKVLYQHNMRDPIGTARVAQDSKGLAFEGQLVLEAPSGAAAHALMKAGALDGMSIGYDVLPGGAEMTKGGVRSLTALKLWEISPVTFGMNPAAGIDSVKTLPDRPTTLREFEAVLRDLGFTRKEATRISSQGFAGFEPDADPQATINAAIKAATSLWN